MWTALGAALSLGVLTPFTIGLPVLGAAVVAVAVLLTRPGARNCSVAGLISGAGLVPLYVGYLNRHGPGDVCTVSAAGGQHCVSEWSPVPWIAVGVVLVLGGAGLFVVLRRGYGTG